VKNDYGTEKEARALNGLKGPLEKKIIKRVSLGLRFYRDLTKGSEDIWKSTIEPFCK
jgi:hypothetical protein